MGDWIQVLIAIIGAAASVAAVVITNRASNREITHKLETNQAVTDTKLQALTDEVRSHNEFARRMPVVEEQIKVINHRIDDLENERRDKS